MNIEIVTLRNIGGRSVKLFFPDFASRSPKSPNSPNSISVSRIRCRLTNLREALIVEIWNRFKDRSFRVFFNTALEAMTKIHPLPNKRSVARQKKLRRLPHVFEKVLELPVGSSAEVDVEESDECFRFSATADGLGVEIRAEAIEVFPGVTKVVIRGDSEVGYDGLEIDRWRFRLPECTRLEMASAAYVSGGLVVIVPKR